MKRALVVAVILVAACSSGARYVKPGASENDLKADSAACKAEWREYRMLASDAVDACLQGKGWREKPAS